MSIPWSTICLNDLTANVCLQKSKRLDFLRHAFASRNIIRWIDAGRDVMELLPYLSAYMGHSELTSTLYYVHLLPEKLRRSKGVDWDFLSSIYGKGVPDDED